MLLSPWMTYVSGMSLSDTTVATIQWDTYSLAVINDQMKVPDYSASWAAYHDGGRAETGMSLMDMAVATAKAPTKPPSFERFQLYYSNDC